MPFKCSVPGCKSNYKPPYVTCFRFPKDTARRKFWINRIHRDNFLYTDNARVCIKHFDKSMIIREDSWTDTNGKVHKIPRVNPILTQNAFPSFISESTPHLNASVSKKRKSEEEKEEDRIQQCLADSVLTHTQEVERAQLKCLSEVKLYVKHCLKDYSSWTYIFCNSMLTVVKLCYSDIPIITASIKVSEDLSFEIYCNNERLNANILNLNFTKIESKHHIDILLNACNNFNLYEKNIMNDKFSRATKLLEESLIDLDEKKNKNR